MNVANLQREGLVMAVNNALVRKGLLSNRSTSHTRLKRERTMPRKPKIRSQKHRQPPSTT